MLSGIIPVYKEKSYTSFDVVAKLRGILKIKKIGHTGTLDPDAEGVLPVCAGSATKLVEMLTDSVKEYEARMIFGITTDTQDVSGKILSECAPDLSEADIKKAILSFEGEYDQIPPMYSALKVGGRKLYELAREGKTVERKPRRVNIYKIDILKTDISGTEKYADIRVSCSKGTYIRTLIHDIGALLGCGACMKSLKRTKAAGFEADQCFTLDEIQKKADAGEIDKLIILPETVFENYPKVNVKKDFDTLLNNGNVLCEDNFLRPAAEAQLIRVYNADGVFKAVYQKEEDVYKVRYMF